MSEKTGENQEVKVYPERKIDEKIQYALRLGVCTFFGVPISKYKHMKAGDIFDELFQVVHQNNPKVPVKRSEKIINTSTM